MARKPKVRAPYKMVSSATWELARAAYLGGETAQAVADRFGIGVHNLRQKIYREGWSKRALADARLVAGPGGPDPRPGPLAPPAATGNLMDVVLNRAREALTAGKGAEATALLKALREYVVVLDDVADAHQANARATEAMAAATPETSARLVEAMALVQLRQIWAPLNAEEAQWRDDARRASGPSVVSEL